MKTARYIKVLLFNPLSIGKPALCGIVKAAHSIGLKVAVHATQIAAVRQAVDAGADILLHVPMKEEYPPELAETIAGKGIAVAPTLVMIETFANSYRNGYFHYLWLLIVMFSERQALFFVETIENGQRLALINI